MPTKIHNNKLKLVASANGLNFVQMYYRGRKRKFLVDTGATISVIFREWVHSNDEIRKSKTITIKGISGSTKSLGSACLKLQIVNLCVCHEFNVMNAFETDVHGVLGSDFLQKYSAVINFEKYIISLNINATEISLPIESECSQYTMLPPRCEIIKYCSICTELEKDCVVLPDEICDGVFVAGILATPEKGKIPVRILNTRNEQVTLEKF